MCIAWTVCVDLEVKRGVPLGGGGAVSTPREAGLIQCFLELVGGSEGFQPAFPEWVVHL